MIDENLTIRVYVKRRLPATAVSPVYATLHSLLALPTIYQPDADACSTILFLRLAATGFAFETPW